MEDRNNTRDELDNMDAPKERDMYVMYVKDIITEQPTSTVRGGISSDGGFFFKTTKHIGFDKASFVVARTLKEDGFLSYTLQVTIVREREEDFFSISSLDFEAWCDPLPELYDILREKYVRVSYDSLKGFLDTGKSETQA
jgi:hypothetical protein